MKTQYIIIFAVVALLLAGPVMGHGTSGITLSPATRTVAQGQTFTVAVVVDPTVTVYTAKAVVSYPANLLEVRSFTFAQEWLPLTQSGYDNVDNTAGVLTKTGGYAGGLTIHKNLGTITFRAKANGTATVTVRSDSQLYNAQSVNVFATAGQSVVTVRAATAGVSPTPTAVAGSPAVSPAREGTETQPATLFLGLTNRTWGILAVIAFVALVIWRVTGRRKPNR